MLLYIIMTKTLVGIFRSVFFLLILCFGESSHVVSEFQLAVQSSDPSVKLVFDDPCFVIFEHIFTLEERNRFALLRAMSKFLNQAVLIDTFESGFPEAYVEVLCTSIDDWEVNGKSLYSVEVLSSFLQVYSIFLRESSTSRPLLSREILLKGTEISLQNLDGDDMAMVRNCQGFLNLLITVSEQQNRCFLTNVDVPKHALKISATMHKSKKAKYRALSILLEYLETSDVLEEIPHYIQSTIRAIASDVGIRKPGVLSLKPIWKNLQLDDDTLSLSRKQSRDILETVVDLMVDEFENVRVSTMSHVIPGLIEECAESFQFLLQSLVSRESSDGWLAACIGLLAFGRKFSAYSSIETLEGEGLHVYELLEKAIIDQEQQVQMAALQLLVAGNASKAIDVPNINELTLIWKYYNMATRCTSAKVRHENLSCYARFLMRIKVSVAATLTRPECFDQAVHANVKLCGIWLQSFCRLCIACLHPGSLYGKRCMAVEFLCMTLEAFDTLIAGHKSLKLFSRNTPYNLILSKDIGIGKGLELGAFYPFPTELYSQATSNLLYSALTDTWDRVRSASMCILLMIENQEEHINVKTLSRLTRHALDLLQRPWLSDLDAGSRILNIVYQKHVVQGQWSIRLLSNQKVLVSIKGEEGSSKMTFIRQIIEMANADMITLSMEQDHGLSIDQALSSLAALRYLIMSMSHDDIMNIIQSAHALLEQSFKIVMPVLSSPEDSLLDLDMKQGDLDNIMETHIYEEQMIRYKSWMISKEICHFIESTWEVVSKVPNHTSVLRSHLSSFAEIIIEMLLHAKHYGTIDYSRETLEKICTLKVHGLDMSSLVMEQMFDHMLRDDQSRRDAIRRSGGLPFGIHSVMVANPKSILTVKSISRLIDICQRSDGNSVDSLWPKVHALNVLRLVFSDNRLSGLDQFNGVSFQVILQSLSDPRWEIRNSAALCFTALVSKVMGFANVGRENHLDLWPQRSPTALEFFETYKDVELFTLERLNMYVLEGEKRNEIGNLLTPVLGLLCRLRPSYSQKCSSAQNRLSYLDALTKIMESREIKIRKLAARAFVSVVPLSMWSGFCRDQSAAVSKTLSSGNPKWNTVHGWFCAMSEILRALYSLMDQNDEIDGTTFFEVGQSICDGIHLQRLPYLAKCPPAGAEFLRICLLLCRLDKRWNDYNIFFFCKDVIAYLWTPLMSLGQEENMQVPMLSVCLKRLVKLAYIWCFPKVIHEEGRSFVTYIQWIKILLKHPYYEVREAALKSVIFSFEMILTCSVDHGEVLDNLRSLYHQVSLSWKEKTAHEENRLRMSLLNTFYRNAWDLCKEQGVISIDMKSIQKHSNDPSMLYEAILIQAYAIRLSRHGASFTHILKVYSQPEHPEEIRMACVHGMEIIKGLRFSPGSSDQQILDFLGIWNTAFILLEDEDSSVRLEMARVALDAMNVGARRELRVEYVQEMALPWLKDQLASHPAFVRQLQTWICDPEEHERQLIEEIQSKDDKRLFLVEKTNQYEDPMILVNLASAQLALLTPDQNETDLLNWLGLSSQSLCNILEFFEDLEKKYEEPSQHSFDLYSSNAYQHMYRLWAAVWSSSHACIHAGLELPVSTETLKQKVQQNDSVILQEFFLAPDLSSLIDHILAPDRECLDSIPLDDSAKIAFPISSRLRITT